MKKALPVLFITLSWMIILARFDADTAFMHLILAGEVPGTSIIIPATTMLLGYFVLASLLMLGILASFVSSLRHSKQQIALQQLPRRRFTQAI